MTPTPASTEAVWQSLRQHLEWSDSFWIVWLFAEQGATITTLQERLAELLKLQGSILSVHTLSRPSDVPPLLEEIARDRRPRVLWLRADGVGQEGADAWRALHLRLNESREHLKRLIQHGIVLVGPPYLKEIARDAGPDLWSIRSLVLEPTPTPDHLPSLWQPPPLLPDLHAYPSYATDPVLAAEDVQRAIDAGQPDAEIQALLRLAGALFSQECLEESRQAALRAAQHEAATRAQRSEALSQLAVVEHHLGDFVAALEHMTAAVDSADPRDLRLLARLKLGQSMLLLRCQQPQQAMALARDVLPSIRDDPDLLSECLFLLGQAALSLEDYAQAEHVLGESLRLSQEQLHTGSRTKQIRLAGLMGALASASLSQGKIHQAVDLSRRALAILETSVEDRNSALFVLITAATAESMRGHGEDARRLAGKGLKWLNEPSLRETRRLQYGAKIHDVAGFSYLQDQPQKAATHLQTALTLARQLPRTGPEASQNLMVLSETLLANGTLYFTSFSDPMKALPYFEELLQTLRERVQRWPDDQAALRELAVALESALPVAEALRRTTWAAELRAERATLRA